MKYTINQIHDILYKKTLEVYDVFKDFFDEPYVDLQIIQADAFKTILRDYMSNIQGSGEEGYEITNEDFRNLEASMNDIKSLIYIWWPNVTVTNENDKSVVIQDLYAKIEVRLDGTIPPEYIGFTLNRATYPAQQFESNYLHSHIREIPKNNFSTFMSPCLGSGPIKDTILTLKNESSEEMWMLFCEELSMYVTVESLNGGPWKHLENIGALEELGSHTGYDFNKASRDVFAIEFPGNENLRGFLKYYLEKGHLQLSFMNGKFTCSMPYHEYIIDVSNAFIDYFNSHLKTTKEALELYYSHELLYSVIFDNGKFYKQGNNVSTQSLYAYQDKFVLTFKGKCITTKILESSDSNVLHTVTIIDNSFAMFVLKRILRTINYKYRNGYNERRDQNPSTVGKRVIYI